MPRHSNNQAIDTPYDVAVIGAGVVGCAVARRFILEGARVALLERTQDILSGASKGNSAILHTGFDAPLDSLEAQCIREGNREYRAIRKRLNLPLLETGAVMVAWDAIQRDQLDDVVSKAHKNGISEVRRIEISEVKELFPSIGPGAFGGVYVPTEAIIDPWSAPLAYIKQAVENEGHLEFGCEVLGGHFDGDAWRLHTTTHEFNTHTVINCAGLFGDTVDKQLLGESEFNIRPRKGQFIVLDKAARRHVSRILLPVPTETTKGVLITPTIFGNVLIGPTAEEQEDRNHARVDNAGIQRLKDAAIQHVPDLKKYPVVASYAGLRPATNEKDFQVHNKPDQHWITVGGIRSTGLSAALGLANHVYDHYHTTHGSNSKQPLTNPIWPTVPNLAEDQSRDWESEGFGEIVCHCELVTRREIETAIAGPVPARDMSGLKRRTRATMGRCQGFYCSARIAELAQGRLDPGIAVEQINE